MLNSLILMFGQYEKNRKASTAFKVLWGLYAIAASVFNFNLLFSAISISAFLLMAGAIHHISKIYPKINAILSVSSILVYSLLVDIICYYVFPSWAKEQSLMQYITNGFLFNCKYVFVNAATFMLVVLCPRIFKKYKIIKFKDQYSLQFQNFSMGLNCRE